MAYRGRLIHPFMVEMYRLDLETMGTDDDLDEDYREPKMASTEDGRGEPGRQEMLPIRIPGQIEPDSFNRQTMRELGDQKAGVFGLTFHFKDLERMNLVDAETGIALIRPGDRMAAIYTKKGKLVQTFPDPPGMYVTEATPTGIGMGGERNLLLVRLQSRK
jgi:hypothetical protein